MLGNSALGIAKAFSTNYYMFLTVSLFCAFAYNRLHGKPIAGVWSACVSFGGISMGERESALGAFI